MGQETQLPLSPIEVNRMRTRPFSKGRISKKIPPDFAVPPHKVDTALRKGAWPQTTRTQFLYWHGGRALKVIQDLRPAISSNKATSPKKSNPPFSVAFMDP
jgi:hypothetical protein